MFKFLEHCNWFPVRINTVKYLFILRYCYTDDFNVDKSMDKLDGVLHLADKYQVNSMKAVCSIAIKEKLSPDNAITIYSLACTFNTPALKADALDFISDNATKCFESPDFLCQPQALINALTSRDSLNITESVLLQRVLEWAIHECKRKDIDDSYENLHSVLGPVLTNIRFMSIPDEVFQENIMIQRVLKEEELQELNKLYENSKNNEKLASDIFQTKPRKGHKYMKVFRCNATSLARCSYSDKTTHGMCFEVSGPLWLRGVSVFRGVAESQYLGIKIQLQIHEQGKRKILQTVERITEYTNTDNTIDILFQEPIRVVNNGKYTVLLIIFGSGSVRELYHSNDFYRIDQETFCGETVTFSSRSQNSPKSIGHFAALLLEGMKWTNKWTIWMKWTNNRTVWSEMN